MDKKKIDLSIPLFFVWPFGAFLMTFFSFSSRRSNVIYVLFTTIFGYSFSFTDPSADSYRVAMVFDMFDYGAWHNVFQEYSSGFITDLYKHLSFSLIEGFTDNPKVLFAFFGFIFGIFSYKSIKLFLNVKGIEKGFSILILCLIFISLNPIININGARFWTAAIICFCSVINLVVFDKKIWLLGLLSTVFFHFSFLIIIPFFLGIYFFKKKLLNAHKTTSWIFILFIISFLFSLVLDNNLINLNIFSKILPGSIASKVELYNSGDLSELYEERSKTFFHTVSKSFGYAARIYIFFLVFEIKKVLKNDNIVDPVLQKMFNFVLLFFSITFMLSLFPSGGRFTIIAYQVFYFFLIRFYVQYKSNRLQKFILGLVPVYSFTILFNVFFLSIVLTESTIWYGNVIWIIYEGIGYTFVYL